MTARRLSSIARRPSWYIRCCAPVLCRFKLYCSLLGRRILPHAVKLKFCLSNLISCERFKLLPSADHCGRARHLLQLHSPCPSPSAKFYPGGVLLWNFIRCGFI